MSPNRDREDEVQARYDGILLCRYCETEIPDCIDYCPSCKRKVRHDRRRGGARGEQDLVDRMSSCVGRRLCEGFHGGE